MSLIPEVFYVFVARAGFETRHNLDVTGCFLSAGFSAAFPDAAPAGTMTAYAPGPDAPHGDDLTVAYLDGSLDHLMFTPNPAYAGWPTPFVNRIVTEYRLEYDAEVCRRFAAPHKPSRLSAVYAFGDRDACSTVSERYGWDLRSVQHFRLRPHPHNRVAKANMEIVSLMRWAYSRAAWSPRQLDQIWRAYWSEEPSVTVEVPTDGTNFERRESGCVWEYLIEGCLERG